MGWNLAILIQWIRWRLFHSSHTGADCNGLRSGTNTCGAIGLHGRKSTNGFRSPKRAWVAASAIGLGWNQLGALLEHADLLPGVALFEFWSRALPISQVLFCGTIATVHIWGYSPEAGVGAARGIAYPQVSHGQGRELIDSCDRRWTGSLGLTIPYCITRLTFIFETACPVLFFETSTPSTAF